MKKESQTYEKKSLKLFDKKNPDWKKLYKSCVAFANSEGGKLFIGIEDDIELPPPNQNISQELINRIISNIKNNTFNVGITYEIHTFDNGGNCLIINVKRNSESIASTTDGKYYIRIGDESKALQPDELSRLMQDKGNFSWELKNYLKIRLSDCDEEKLKLFINDIKNSDRVSERMKEQSNNEILEYFFLTDNDYLTNLGILWIGKRMHRAKLLYSPVIQVIKYDERQNKIQKINYDSYDLTPKELIQKVWADILDFREYIEIPDGIFRKNVYFYDETIIRELLANAIVHKPYTTRGDIFIKIYPDKIEFINPGLLPYPVTPTNILHKTVARNPKLVRIFYNLKLVENEGSGYDKIYENLLFSGKELPEIIEEDDSVKITIFKKIVNFDIIKLLDSINDKFNLNQKAKITLSLIAQNESLRLSEIIKFLGVNESTFKKEWISYLLDNNILVTKGKSSNTNYLVNPILVKGKKSIDFTTLKSIEAHRLKALILEDLEKYPNSKRGEIHERIGIEIRERYLRTVLKQLLEEEKIIKNGLTKSTTYKLNLDLI